MPEPYTIHQPPPTFVLIELEDIFEDEIRKN